ncbi:hypothetical protein [uncultured Gulosibacter sp.]|uniref:hypothetical protein n=1 Tax=uncultured Gulosibacter sp. TaxID=1339167 RepID=UPI002889AE92|nr:hypothetical protein [uncultured Gulosibacter sp.]
MTSQPARALAATAFAVVAALLTAGCTASPIAVEDPRTQSPTSTQPAETPELTANPEPTVNEPTGAPTITGAEPSASETAKKPPRVDALRIGGSDFSALDWDVTCGGLDGAPSVLGTAERDGKQYVFMLLASGSDQLLSFTFSYGPASGGHASKTGLTVTPGGGQGNGTFTIDGARIISDGRGISYSPEGAERTADTLYTAEFTCDLDK